jgi:hypothetical protein
VLVEREKPRKTTSATFRIDAEIHEALQAHARMNNMSVNTLINQLLDVWSDNDRFMDEVGLVRITRPNFKKFLKALPESRLAEIGSSAGKDLARSYMMAKDGGVSTTGVLHYVKVFSQHGGYARYNETETNGKKVIVLMHEFGRAGSAYISAYVRSVFDLVDIRPVVTTNEASVVIEL